MFRSECVIVLLVLNLGCNMSDQPKKAEQIENNKRLDQFDAELWKIQDGMDYPNRDRMIDDLITQEMLKPLKKSEIIALLGIPDRLDSNYLFYTIDQKRIGLWPLHTKTLVIEARDSLANRIMIHE